MFAVFEVCHSELDSRWAFFGRGVMAWEDVLGVLDEEKGVKHVETHDKEYDTVGGLVIRL